MAALETSRRRRAWKVEQYRRRERARRGWGQGRIVDDAAAELGMSVPDFWALAGVHTDDLGTAPHH